MDETHEVEPKGLPIVVRLGREDIERICRARGVPCTDGNVEAVGRYVRDGVEWCDWDEWDYVLDAIADLAGISRENELDGIDWGPDDAGDLAQGREEGQDGIGPDPFDIPGCALPADVLRAAMRRDVPAAIPDETLAKVASQAMSRKGIRRNP